MQCRHGQARAGASGRKLSQAGFRELEGPSGPSCMEAIGPPSDLEGLSIPLPAGAAGRGLVWDAERVVSLA